MNCVLAITIKFSATQKTEKSLQTILAFDTVHLYQDITFRVLHLPVRTVDPQTLRSVNDTLVALAEKFSMIKSTKKMAFVRRLQARIEDMAALENQGLQYMSPKKRFTRNIWGDILNTGFSIVSEIIPNYYVKAMIRSIQASLIEKKSGRHFLTTNLDRKLRRINDQLNSLKEVSTMQKMNRQFSDIERKIFTYEKHQLFLKHQIAEAARRGALTPGLAAASSIRSAVTHLKRTLGSGEKLALTYLGSLYELKAHLVQNDENLYISIGIPVVRVEDKRQGSILKNNYILGEKEKKLEILKIKIRISWL